MKNTRVEQNNRWIYAIKCESFWRRHYHATSTSMATEPNSSQVSLRKPQKQGVRLPSSWFRTALRPDRSVLQPHTINSTDFVCRAIDQVRLLHCIPSKFSVQQIRTVLLTKHNNWACSGCCSNNYSTLNFTGILVNHMQLSTSISILSKFSPTKI